MRGGRVVLERKSCPLIFALNSWPDFNALCRYSSLKPVNHVAHLNAI
jgi:hypothetical protein